MKIKIQKNYFLYWKKDSQEIIFQAQFGLLNISVV